MGIQLVGLAFKNWASLGDRPFRALVYMAFKALDFGNAGEGIPPERYFGGWPAIARAMGHARPDSTAATQVVFRAITVLIDQGAIECVKAGHPGQNAEYDLFLYRCPKQ